jgi:hypothetical protein
MFVGVLTNAIFAMLLTATAPDTRRPGIEPIVFFGINAALVGFVVSLLSESTTLMRISTPVLGAAILLGLVDQTLRLQASRAERTPVGFAAAPGS